MPPSRIIADLLEVHPHPTVVRLDDLHASSTDWISESYYITDDVKKHFHALKVALTKQTGTGIFLIGHYGSGKSHFLAYLIQQLNSGLFHGYQPTTRYLSLVNYSAEHTLESIVLRQLDIPASQDRRQTFADLQQKHPQGILLILDELSEFLKSKSEPALFNEDIRFLQFLGEWAQDHKLLILAALQEQIEHTGDFDHGLYRKIKDRFPLRFLLTPVHVQDLIAHTLLIKKPDYDDAVEHLVMELTEGMPEDVIDKKSLTQLYPLHPVTLDLLEEVRDCFSQARGIVEFVVTQMRGHDERQITPFLQQPWGELITPDYIVDHFRDLFDIQPEFVALSNQYLSFYRKYAAQLFPQQKQQKLAKQLIKLLMLVYISPARDGLQAKEAVYWLVFRATRLDFNKNIELVRRVLDTLVDKGKYVERIGSCYCLNLKQDSSRELSKHIDRAKKELDGRAELVFDLLSVLLGGKPFNPFQISQHEWQPRNVRWHFHDRPYRVCLGKVEETHNTDTIHLLIGLPWMENNLSNEVVLLQPAAISLESQWLELAAMLRVIDHPLSNSARTVLNQKIKERAVLFYTEVKQAYHQAGLYSGLQVDKNLILDVSKPFPEVIEQIIVRVLRKRYPSFERFAPSYGPLAKQHWLKFLSQGLNNSILSMQANDSVKLILEAYCLPMGLVKRHNREYIVAKRLDRQELVSIVLSMLEHEPNPGVIYRHLSEPVYGLVEDQVHCLLYFLLIQGEIDILKDQNSLRDHYETLIDPRQYDRIIAAQALSENEVNALGQMLRSLDIKVPDQWTVSSQRHALDQLQTVARQHRQQLHNLELRLPDTEHALKQNISNLIQHWKLLDKGEDGFLQWQQFLYEIDSVGLFINEHHQLSSLPDKINHFLSELGRYQHIQMQFRQLDRGMIDSPQFEAPPSLENPDRFEAWLDQAGQQYNNWCEEYTKKHDNWWVQQHIEACIDWKPDAISNSRHLGLADKLNQLETLRNTIKHSVCRGIDKLEYQPFCHCGFDGRKAPVMQQFEEFESLRKTIEKQLTHFFQQDKVRKRTQQWLEQGIDFNQVSQDYISGKAKLPQIEEIDLFDSYLSGVEVTHVIESNALLDSFCGAQWEPKKLADALQKWVGQFEQYASIRIENNNPVDKAVLLDWILRQALINGSQLPKQLSSQDQQYFEQIIQPDWVHPAVWKKLDNMGLADGLKIKILRWFVDGSLSNIPATDLSTSVGLVQQLGQAIEAGNYASLATRSKIYYQHHVMLKQVNKKRWLQQLDQLATLPIKQPIELLEAYIVDNKPDQWLVLDAFGLPLLDSIKQHLTAWFPNWRLDSIDFMLAPEKTTTDEFYKSLLNAEGTYRFEKINVIDNLLHDRFMAFDDFCQLVTAELGIAIKNRLQQFDSGRPLMISSDHGFRLAKDGNSYQHGGSSTLERTIPVLWLLPEYT